MKARYVFAAIGGFFAVVIVGTVLALALGWFGAAANVVSPAHVKQVYAEAYGDYEALSATAQNVCAIDSELKAMAPGSDAAIQAMNLKQGYVTNYTRIQAEYNALVANIFEGQKVKPRDLPFEAPGLDAMRTAVC